MQCGGGCYSRQELFTKRHQCSAPTAGQETEVSDADEPARQNMQQEATQEFIHVESQEALLVVMSGVSPAEGDLVIKERNQTVIGDCDTMGVGTEVAEHVLRSAEGSLAINDPVGSEKLADIIPEKLRLSKALE